MANSKLNNRPYLLLLALMLPFAVIQAASLKQSTAAITVDSDGAEVDARTKQMVFPKVRIAQDGYVIKADEARATGLDFENSQWTFTGNVNISTPDGLSKADRATVMFVQNQITELHIVGQPATFEQRNANKETLAQGHAGNIDYDFQKNTVRLSQQAWVKYGQNEASSNVLVYDINAQSVVASVEEQQGNRVRITINPNTDQKTAPDTPPSSTP